MRLAIRRRAHLGGWPLMTLLVLLCAQTVGAQQIDILIKGGHVIDPRNDLSAPRDVAITGTTIMSVAADIPASAARRVVDVSGLYVVPGLIDPHTHVFAGGNAGFADGTGCTLTKQAHVSTSEGARPEND